MQRKKFAVIGAGRIGQTLIRALIDSKLVKPDNITATTAHPDTAQAVADKFGVRTASDNASAVEWADVVLLCVKPQIMNDALNSFSTVDVKRKLLISTAAAVPTSHIEGFFPVLVSVVRTMPNTPCLVKMGMTAMSPGKNVDQTHLDLATEIFSTLGRCITLDEKHLDSVTGLSGSGPAFMYMVVEALAEGGVKAGLPRNVATLLAAQTMMGAGAMVLQTGEHPAMLKDAVTTPAGCTIDGILELEEGGLRVTLIKAVVRAARTAAKLFTA